MPFVLDASVSAVWALADETDPLAELILSKWDAEPQKRETAWVPSVWWFELRNVLVSNERRKRLTVAQSNAFLKLLASFPIEIDDRPEENAIFRYTRDYQLSFYDAAYLELAIRKHLPLATLDKALQAAAEAAGVSSLG